MEDIIDHNNSQEDRTINSYNNNDNNNDDNQNVNENLSDNTNRNDIEEGDDIFDSMNLNELNKQELVVAILTVFYKGKLTQTALRLILKLINIVSPIKVPTTFDGLKGVLMENEQKELSFNKTFYCDMCFTKSNVKEMENRFERACNKCKSR